MKWTPGLPLACVPKEPSVSEPVASVMSSVVPRGFEKPTAPVLAATLTVALGVPSLLVGSRTREMEPAP